jgi:hypothetical protein
LAITKWKAGIRMLNIPAERDNLIAKGYVVLEENPGRHCLLARISEVGDKAVIVVANIPAFGNSISKIALSPARLKQLVDMMDGRR